MKKLLLLFCAMMPLAYGAEELKKFDMYESVTIEEQGTVETYLRVWSNPGRTEYRGVSGKKTWMHGRWTVHDIPLDLKSAEAWFKTFEQEYIQRGVQ